MIASLLFTTLLASFAAAGSSGLTFNTPDNLVQCDNSTLSWKGGKAPYSVAVFTSDCNDGVDDAIATFDNVEAKNVTYYVGTVSGEGVFVVVDDADGNSITSDDLWVGGDASKIEKCKETLQAKALAAQSSSSSVAATATTTGSASDNIPTTMSHSSSTTITGNGVANAVKVTSSTHSATATGLTNGASSARPLELAAGVVGAAVALAALL